MKSLARMFLWLPGVDKEIESLVSKCSQCQATQPSPRPSLPLAPLQPWSWPTRPWARLNIDYAGPVEETTIQAFFFAVWNTRDDDDR